MSLPWRYRDLFMSEWKCPVRSVCKCTNWGFSSGETSTFISNAGTAIAQSEGSDLDGLPSCFLTWSCVNDSHNECLISRWRLWTRAAKYRWKISWKCISCFRLQDYNKQLLNLFQDHLQDGRKEMGCRFPQHVYLRKVRPLMKVKL